MQKQRKMRLRTAACVIAAAISAVSLPTKPFRVPVAEAATLTTVANPIIWSDVPDDDVIRVGDTYYMVSTTMYFSPGAPIMKSHDLVSWEICNYVYDTLADGDVQNLTNGKHDYAHGQWATSLRYHNGTYYVFFGSYGTGKSYIFKTNDIENGTWTRSEINGMYHDASMLFDDDGRNYLVYGGGGTIQIKELNAEMTGFKSGGVEQTLFKTGLDNLAGEGAHIQKIGDYYYVFIIAWPSTSGRIELCYRSKDLLGTYEGKTVLNSGLGTYGSGVAQGGIVDTPDGKWYGLLFQDHGAVGRIPVLVPVTWQDNWPMMGVNGAAPLTLQIETDYTGADLVIDDTFDAGVNDLALEWQWNHNPDNTAWSLTERKGYLRLNNKTIATSIINARNTLTQRTEGPSCSSVIKLDASGMKTGDYAGLSAFQFNYGNVGVYVADNGTKYIYMAKNGGYSGSAAVTDSYDTIVEQTALNGNEIYLKVDFLFNTVTSSGSSSNNIDKANFYYSYDNKNWTKIGAELGMTYDLKLFTGYRSGIYSYATKSTGGYADIDSFEYERAEWNVAQVIEPDENGYFFHSTFEGDTDSWNGRGSATIMTSGRTAYNGTEALLVQNREAAWNGAYRSLSAAAFKPGETYSFSVNAINLDGNSASTTFYMKLQYTDAAGETQYSTVAEGTTVQGEWVQLANTAYTIPADATNMQLYVETAEGSDNFYIDEAIGAVAGTKIDGPSGIQLILGDVDFDGAITAADLSAAKQGIKNGSFASNHAKVAADVDQSGAVDATDAKLIREYLTAQITEFPVAEPVEPPAPAFDYNANLQYAEAPSDYLSPCAQSGKVINETYNGINGTNKLNVYLPYGYDESKQYNIFYLMHGGGENENTIFSDDVKLHYILDNMIMNGELEPMIVVTPTFNNCEAATFYKEFRASVIPFVEGKYSTYAKSTSEADLIASRMHRAYGGFSMGALSAWCVGNHALDMVGYLMPLSGDNWEGVSSLTAEIDRLGLQKDEYFIMAATGSEDIAYGNMNPQMEQMKNDSHFTYTSDFSKGNFYYLVADGKTHWWGFVRHYVYDCLPYFFHET